MPEPTTTAQRVFDITMGLIDEVSENSGATDTADTREYKARTLFILNALRGELYPYSDTYQVEEAGKRPILHVIQNFTDVIGMDDYICQTVLPYGLAAQLLLNDDASSAGFFQQRYEELREKLARGLPQGSEDITDVYGGDILPHNYFGAW